MITKFNIIHIETGETVHTVNVMGQSERGKDKVFDGLMNRTDLDQYFIEGVK